MPDIQEGSRVSLPGVFLVSMGALFIWSGLNDPPGGPMGALKGFAMSGTAEAGPGFLAGSLAGAAVAQETATAGNASPIRSSATGGRVAAVAQTYIGVPYKWAGETRAGLDCSGLVLVAYRDGAGIKLPHLATLQAARGKQVASQSNVQPGDLVCWGSPGNVPHIAIALNTQTCVAAWTYGVGVTEGPIHQKAVPGLGYPFFVRIL